MRLVPVHITIIGAGQIGQAFAKAFRARGIAYRKYAYRRGLPTRLTNTDLVLICVRDGQIADAAESLAHSRFGTRTVVAHVSGSIGFEALQPLRARCRGIGQLHPFSSIRSIGHAKAFSGTFFVGDGERAALGTLKQFVRLLGGHFIHGRAIDRGRYHVAAALLANGSVALLSAATALLVQAGIAEKTAEKMLIELERSVLFNIDALGNAAALTGPVRRGDVTTLLRHFSALETVDPPIFDLYRLLVQLQLKLVRNLSELPPRTIQRMLRLVRP